ncbi:MAG: hypothetical protein KAW51_10685 [Candidatus Lokiarchaeota archaeon]|nr:hypothetical protein [Candidatus Lokiarchaeota archaeon]
MGKGGAVLGIIGMLLGAGGLGFAFVVWYGQNALESNINQLTGQNIWHRYYEDIFDVDLINTYMPIPNMSISIDLNAQSSIHLLFTCTAITAGSPLGRSDVTIYYYIDELIISNPNARVGTFYGNNSFYYDSVSLNYFSEGWAAGNHNISIFVRSTVDTNYLQYCHLTVQSFPE